MVNFTATGMRLWRFGNGFLQNQYLRTHGIDLRNYIMGKSYKSTGGKGGDLGSGMWLVLQLVMFYNAPYPIIG